MLCPLRCVAAPIDGSAGPEPHVGVFGAWNLDLHPEYKHGLEKLVV